MLQAIRNRSQGWIAWIIIILISIPFALFGIQEYLGISSNPTAAEVNGVEIKENDVQRRIRDFRENMRLTLGNSYRAELFADARIRSRVINSMIDENVLQQSIDAWNMHAGDTQIRDYIQSIPVFQRDGRFDTTLYQNALRNQGMTSAGFEAAIRSELAQSQLQQGINNSLFITDTMLAEQIRLSEQKRQIRYARIPAASFNEASAVTDDIAQAYFQRNQAAFSVPEQVKLRYVRLNTDTLAHLIEVDDAKLQTFFDERADEFFVEEERKIRHILLSTNADNESAQREKAADLLNQLRSGADFAELVKTHSEDPGSAENGGDLGWINKGVMVAAFEEAAFALAKDTYSEPVKTEFGYHIIRVDAIRGGANTSFAELRDQIAERYKQQEAEALYYTYFERMADAAYENPDNLLPVAELINAKVEQTDWLLRNSQLMIEGLKHPKVSNAAFSEEVLQGNNSDLIEVAPIDAVVIRVAEHEPARVKSLDEVKDQIVKQAATELAAEKAAEQGKQSLQKLRDGATLASLATNSDWQLSDEQEISRDQQDVPAEIVQAAYSIALPQDGKSASYTGVVLAEGDYVLVAVQQVKDGDVAKLDDAGKQTQRQTLQSQLANTEYAQLQEALRERADVEIVQ